MRIRVFSIRAFAVAAAMALFTLPAVTYAASSPEGVLGPEVPSYGLVAEENGSLSEDLFNDVFLGADAPIVAAGARPAMGERVLFNGLMLAEQQEVIAASAVTALAPVHTGFASSDHSSEHVRLSPRKEESAASAVTHSGAVLL